MIPFEISFHSKWPCVDGRYLNSRKEIADCILELAKVNGYQFMPIFRPLPPVVVNYHEVKLEILVLYLKNIYSYCKLFKDKCFVNDSIFLSCNGVTDTFNKDSRFVYVRVKTDITNSIHCVYFEKVGIAVNRLFQQYAKEGNIVVEVSSNSDFV